MHVFVMYCLDFSMKMDFHKLFLLGMHIAFRLICISDMLFFFYHICLVLSKIPDVDVNSIKTIYSYDITELLLKVALNTVTPPPIYRIKGDNILDLTQQRWAVVAFIDRVKMCLKIPKGQSESVYRRTDNTIVKRKSTKGQTTINNKGNNKITELRTIL